LYTSLGFVGHVCLDEGMLILQVTCASASLSCLDDMKFPFVLLDECCQMTEPNALLPIARFVSLTDLQRKKKPRPDFRATSLFLSAIQSSSTQRYLEATLTMLTGLSKPFLTGLHCVSRPKPSKPCRLSIAGMEPIFLRTQYRCHPAITAIANDLFYEGRVRSALILCTKNSQASDREWSGGGPKGIHGSPALGAAVRQCSAGKGFYFFWSA
jgi:hypothetical protein